MKYQVTARVETGNNGGGEDLYVVVSCETEHPEPWAQEFEGEFGTHDQDGYCVEDNGDTTTFTSDHYEFVWSGTPEEALSLLREKLTDEGSWSYCHKPGETPKLRFCCEVLVDGNAD